MAEYPNPTGLVSEDDIRQWDCVLGEATMPGEVEVRVRAGRDVDVKKSKGKDKATCTDNGDDNGEVEIDIELYDDDDWENWLLVLPKIHPRRPGGVRQPLEIRYPDAQLLGINAVIVLEIEARSPEAGGTHRWRIKCIEYVPAPADTSKKAAGQSKDTQTTQARGDFPVHDEITNLTTEQQAFQPSGVQALDQIFPLTHLAQSDPHGNAPSSEPL